ncbi:MAG: M48 family metalloprotease [Deltaproteobacteria bacterium]|jgi:predicted Zn-dependent protease|nr:M48 family metalloprotease [Deltaproteobacteria bacterium]
MTKNLCRLAKSVRLVGFSLLLIVLQAWGASPLGAVSQKEELEIGRMVHRQLAGQRVLFNDPLVDQYIRRIGNRVLKAAGPQSYPFHYYVIQSDGLNAFAVPGGYIYLHTETIISLQNEGQLAAILAHETAHITSRHFASRQEAGKTASIASLAGILAGALLAAGGGSGQNTAALGQALMLGSVGASMQAMLANSRADESEADRKGRDYMIKAGYNPRDMFGAFKIMNDLSYHLSSGMPNYLSTHPGLAARMASTFADQANKPPAPADLAYAAIRDRVLALSAQTLRARRMFQKRLETNPNDASAIHGLGLLAAREQSLTQANDLMEKALKLSPNNPEYLTDLGDLALRRRKISEAAAYYEKARAQGSNLASTLGLARAYELQGKSREAGGLYDKAVEMGGDDYPEALELAGRFFGQNGQMVKGHYLLSRYFGNVGQLKEAIFHCKTVAKDPAGQLYKRSCEQDIRDYEEIMKDSKKL